MKTSVENYSIVITNQPRMEDNPQNVRELQESNEFITVAGENRSLHIGMEISITKSFNVLGSWQAWNESVG